MTTHGGKERARALATAILAAALLAVPARAAFDDLGAGARAPGMGNAFTAIADDVYAIYYNPAGLALLDRPTLAASHTQHLAGLSDGSGLNTSFLGYAHPLKWDRGTVAAGVQNFSLDGSFYNEQAYYLSYAREVPMSLELYDLYWGLNVKNLRRSFGSLPEATNAMSGLTATGQADPVLSGKRSVNVFDADLGLLYKIGKGYTAGLELMHLATPNVAFSPTDTDKLPLRTKLALGYSSMLSNIAAQYETANGPTGTRDHRLTMAAERWFPWLLVGNIGARAALSVGSRDFRQASAGLSYRTGRIGVDYGFILPINSIASTYGTHRLSFSIRFGPVQEEEESAKLVLAAMRALKSGRAPELAAPAASPAYAGALRARLDRARFLEAEGRYPEAALEISSALELSPKDEPLRRHHARLNLVSGQLGRLEAYKTDSVQSALYRSALAFLTGSDEEAVAQAASALALRPASRQVSDYLAQLELTTGLQARKSDLAPEIAVKVQNLLTMASESLEDSRYDEAALMSEAVLKYQPENLTALENLGIAYFAQGEYQKSLDAWKKTYRLETGKARQTMIKSQIASVENVAKQQKRKAEGNYGAAARPAGSAEPAQAQKLYREALDLYSSGELLKAQAAFQKVLEADPGNVPAANAIKRIQRELR
jgi:tetratricopeptide (TPR) repeat protein